MGGDGATERNEADRPIVTEVGQHLGAGEQGDERAGVTPSPRQVAELQKDTGFTVKITAGLEGAADLLKPQELHRLVILAGAQDGIEPHTFWTVGTDKVGPLPGAQICD